MSEPNTKAGKALLDDYGGIGIDIGRREFTERLVAIEQEAIKKYRLDLLGARSILTATGDDAETVRLAVKRIDEALADDR